MNAAQIINQTSGRTEWYTPPAIIEAARRTLGQIDLDPASCEYANRIVRANHYYTAADDGLGWHWYANTIWLNHPFGRESNPAWIGKLIDGFQRKHFHAACCITFACTSEEWFGPLFAFPMCFLRPRTNYLKSDGEPVRGVTKGSVVTYLGSNVIGFIENFGGLGAVMLPMEVGQ